MRTYAFGDTSRIAVLFGRESGKFRVISKGYRDPKNGCARALEPFRRIEIVYYHRPSRELQIAAQADILHVHRDVESDLARYHYASAVLELTDYLLPDEEPAPELFTRVSEVLDVLPRCAGGRAALVFRAFQAQACALSGFLPELEVCAVCDGPVHADRRFSSRAGGFVCDRCAEGAAPVDAMTSEAAGLFRFLIRSDFGAVADAYSSVVRPPAVEVAGFIERFMSLHLERYAGLRSLEVLGRLQRHRREHVERADPSRPPLPKQPARRCRPET